MTFLKGDIKKTPFHGIFEYRLMNPYSWVLPDPHLGGQVMRATRGLLCMLCVMCWLCFTTSEPMSDKDSQHNNMNHNVRRPRSPGSEGIYHRIVNAENRGQLITICNKLGLTGQVHDDDQTACTQRRLL